jgi:hypothetical protein
MLHLLILSHVTNNISSIADPLSPDAFAHTFLLKLRSLTDEISHLERTQKNRTGSKHRQNHNFRAPPASRTRVDEQHDFEVAQKLARSEREAAQRRAFLWAKEENQKG